MTPDEICAAAAQGLMPDGLDQPGAMLYATMRRVYADFADGLISKADGAREKSKAVAGYNETKKLLEFYEQYTAQSAERYKRTEAARTNARKNPCAETALALADAIDGLMKE